MLAYIIEIEDRSKKSGYSDADYAYGSNNVFAVRNYLADNNIFKKLNLKENTFYGGKLTHNSGKVYDFQFKVDKLTRFIKIEISEEYEIDVMSKKYPKVKYERFSYDEDRVWVNDCFISRKLFDSLSYSYGENKDYDVKRNSIFLFTINGNKIMNILFNPKTGQLIMESVMNFKDIYDKYALDKEKDESDYKDYVKCSLMLGESHKNGNIYFGYTDIGIMKNKEKSNAIVRTIEMLKTKGLKNDSTISFMYKFNIKIDYFLKTKVMW